MIDTILVDEDTCFSNGIYDFMVFIDLWDFMFFFPLGFLKDNALVFPFLNFRQ